MSTGLFRLAVAFAVALVNLSACGVFSSRQDQSNDWNAEVSVLVDSHNSRDIVVYLMDGSQSRRLGMVNAVSTKSFVFPYRQLATGGKVRLRAYPVGGNGSFTSEDVLLQPGQSVRWTLESDLSRSSLAVY